MQFTDEDVVNVSNVLCSNDSHLFNEYFIKSLHEAVEFIKAYEVYTVIGNMFFIHFHTLGKAEFIKFLMTASENSVVFNYISNPTLYKIVTDYDPLLRAANKL